MTTVSYILLALLLLCPVEPPQHAQELAEQIFLVTNEANSNGLDADHLIALQFHALKCGWPDEQNYTPANRVSTTAQAIRLLDTYQQLDCSLRDIDYHNTWRYTIRRWWLRGMEAGHHDESLNTSWSMFPIESPYSDRSTDCRWSATMREEQRLRRQWRRWQRALRQHPQRRTP